MLIEFSVTNYRSFKERQTLSLVKAEGGDLVDTNTFKPEGATDIELLRTAALYGPNAGGKSNLLRAMNTMERIVLNSADKGQHGKPLPIKPFLLDNESARLPSEFEAVFIAGGTRYQYGFAATKDKVTSEWLFAFPEGEPQQWIDRSWDTSSGLYKWNLGDALTGQKETWRETTRPNALFLSTAVQLNSEQLKPVYDWFRNTLYVIDSVDLHPGITASLYEEHNRPDNKKVLGLIKAADISIDGLNVKLEEVTVSPNQLPDDMPQKLKEALIEGMRGSKQLTVKTSHQTGHGETVDFEMQDESDGTQKLFFLAGPLLNALKSGHVLLVDELHGSFHPHMTRFILSLFHSGQTNPKGAQLVFATHETSVLNREILRQDQVWFCEKNKDKASVLFPLSDFKSREGVENLESAYLSGRYGALPYFGEVDLGRGGQ